MIAEALGTLWNCVLGLIFLNMIICAVITAGVQNMRAAYEHYLAVLVCDDSDGQIIRLVTGELFAKNARGIYC